MPSCSLVCDMTEGQCKLDNRLAELASHLLFNISISRSRFFHNHLSGCCSETSTLSTFEPVIVHFYVIRTDLNIPSQTNVTSSREVGCCSNSTDNARPSSSRTQSLDMDMLVAHATHPSTLKCNPIPDGDGSRKIDPSNRWVKRLRLSTANPPAHGTKISDLGENSSHDKMSRFFRKFIKDSMTSSEPAVGNCCGKELMVSDKTGDLSSKGEFTNVDHTNTDKDLLLSHSWIQRLLHNGSTITQKKSKSVVICEPQSLQVALENDHGKQFPSVAAMALMGKAMTGFQPCELQNRGSFVVWNTRAF